MTILFCYISHLAGSRFLIKWIAHLKSQLDIVTGYCGSPWDCAAKSDMSNFWRKSIFCVLGGPKKLFWPPKTLFGLRNLTYGGGHTSKTFWSEQWFWSYRFQNRYFLKKLFPIPWPRSKSLRSMTPSKVRFLRQYKVLRAQKSFFGPLKTQKIDFLKKGPSYNSCKT